MKNIALTNYVRALVTYRFWILFVLSLGLINQSQASVYLVENGEPRAVVVIPDSSSASIRLAAQELIEHVKLSTGVQLQVLSEKQQIPDIGYRVYLGPTKAAGLIGLQSDKLSADSFILRFHDNNLYVYGKDGEGDYDYRSGTNGTLYGVYEVLERSIGVLWLWPGQLGTYVPEHQTIKIEEVQEIVEPALSFREYRSGHVFRQAQNYQDHVKRLAFSPEGLKNYNNELRKYLRRHRLGSSERKPVVGHVFGDWWQRYGEQHPDWFAMNDKGERVGPTMNVANPELHKFIVEEVWDGESNLSLGEADRRFYCRSPESMAWDKPQPKDWHHYVTSNRYARFAQTIRDMARTRNPDGDFLITMFIYMDYFHAPTINVDLEGVYGEFCPWFSGFTPWYPMSENLHEKYKSTWKGWKDTGMVMGYRPNYLLFGYTMPHLSTWQSGEMFQFAAKHGMIGHDFDSLYGHWAVKGPMLYMHMRLSVDPNQDIKDLRREYFSVFGPAAKQVEDYFDYWENHSIKRPVVSDISEPWRLKDMYLGDHFSEGQKLLKKALAAAQSSQDSQYAQRVKFLQAGLEHARLSVEFISLLEGKAKVPEQPERYLAAREALQRLIQFRRDHESLFIADYIAAAAIENRRFDIDALLNKPIDDGKSSNSGNTTVEALVPWISWFFRKDAEDIGIHQKWFVADLVSSSKGILVYDIGGQTFDIDRNYWTPVNVPSQLSDTSVGSYQGHGWYVTSFVGPDSWKDKKVTLHFEAVSDQAWVYLNGQYIGEHSVKSTGKRSDELRDQPFTLEVPVGLIVPGEQNLLMVRIHSESEASGIRGEVGCYVLE